MKLIFIYTLSILLYSCIPCTLINDININNYDSQESKLNKLPTPVIIVNEDINKLSPKYRKIIVKDKTKKLTTFTNQFALELGIAYNVGDTIK